MLGCICYDCHMESEVCDIMSVKFRASSVGNLMVGGNAITEKQLSRLEELLVRRDDGKKPLTDKMQEELDDLLRKKYGEFEFGLTAKSYIQDCWLFDNFGYEEPVVTNEMLKGMMCEDEAIDIVCRQIDGGFRVKNNDQFEDDHFTGTPDIITEPIVEDLKCSWTLRTFVEASDGNPLYYAQGQAYLALTGCSLFRLIYVLVETPFELVEEEKKKYFFKFNCDENNPYYLEAIRKVEAMHSAARLIPERSRVKVFEFARNDEYIDKLRMRVEQARKVYETFTLWGS